MDQIFQKKIIEALTNQVKQLESEIGHLQKTLKFSEEKNMLIETSLEKEK